MKYIWLFLQEYGFVVGASIFAWVFTNVLLYVERVYRGRRVRAAMAAEMREGEKVTVDDVTAKEVGETDDDVLAEIDAAARVTRTEDRKLNRYYAYSRVRNRRLRAERELETLRQREQKLRALEV